jgi:hypothetical protein
MERKEHEGTDDGSAFFEFSRGSTFRVFRIFRGSSQRLESDSFLFSAFYFPIFSSCNPNVQLSEIT